MPLAFLFLIVPLLAQSQITKEVKRSTPGHDVKEVYSVLKSDKNIKQGDYKMYYRKREITAGQYSADKRTGLWTFKDVDMKVYFIGKYAEGLKDSTWTYYKDNALSAKLYFTKGRIDSVFGYYPNGKVAYMQRIDSNGNGHAYSFYPNGVIKESIPIYNNVIDGICSMGFETGRLFRRVEVRNNRIVTVLETRDPDGRSIDGGTLKDGTGTYLRYFPDSMQTGAFNFGILATYKDGILDGPYKLYNTDGQLIFTGQFVDGHKTGYWRQYNASGFVDSVLFEPNLRYEIGKEDATSKRIIGYFVPEIMPVVTPPEFQNGIDGLHNFIMLNRLFPSFLVNQRRDELGKLLHASRRIYVICYVDIDGSFSDFQLLENVKENPWVNRPPRNGIWIADPIEFFENSWRRDPDYTLWFGNIIFGELNDRSPERTRYNEETLRLTETMPRWTPAFRQQIPISCPIGIIF